MKKLHRTALFVLAIAVTFTTLFAGAKPAMADEPSSLKGGLCTFYVDELYETERQVGVWYRNVAVSGTLSEDVRKEVVATSKAWVKAYESAKAAMSYPRDVSELNYVWLCHTAQADTLSAQAAEAWTKVIQTNTKEFDRAKAKAFEAESKVAEVRAKANMAEAAYKASRANEYFKKSSE